MSSARLPFSQYFGNRKKLTPRRILRMLHLYTGLLCSGYFIMIGLSSISLNHAGSFVAPPAEMVTWEATIPREGTLSGGKLNRANRVKESLGLIGTMPPWRIKQGGGELSFYIWRPGRSYDVAFAHKTGTARVAEKREGLWGVARHLHGLPQIDELAGWSRAWWLYNEISLATVLLALVSGAILWWPRIRERRTGLVVTAIGAVLCLLFMVAVWRL